MKSLIALFIYCLSLVVSAEPIVCIPRQPQQNSKEAVEIFEKSQGGNLRDQEILVRLVFAETLNTNYFLDHKCEEQGPLIAKAIAWGTMNRVRSGNVAWNSTRKTAFAPFQFPPAISETSVFADLFTCPTLLQQNQMNEQMAAQKHRFLVFAERTKRTAAYEKFIPRTLEYAKVAAEEAIGGTIEQNPFLQAGITSSVQNFYYPLSDDVKYGNPNWNKCNQPLDNIYIDGQKLESYCIRFFSIKQIQSTRCTSSDSSTDLADEKPVQFQKVKKNKLAVKKPAAAQKKKRLLPKHTNKRQN